MKATPERVRDISATMSRHLQLNPSQSKTAQIILTSAFITGPDEHRIHELTGIPLDFIHERGERLRRSGYWYETHVYGGEWLDEQKGQVEFLFAIMCAEGEMMRFLDRS